MSSPMSSVADDVESPKARVYSAPALEKGIDVLELLASDGGALTISEIAQRLGRSISELFRIIVVMERRRWLHKDPHSDRYGVTYRLLDVAFRATPAQHLTSIAAPITHDLADQTGQSCHLVILGDGQGMVVQRQENTGPVGFAMRLGATVDLAVSCSGHVLLAFLPDDRRDAVIDALPRRADFTSAALRDRLDAVRSQGFEMQPSARTQGVTDISYPVFGFDGNVAAALTIPYLLMIDGSQRTDLEQARDLLRDAAARISTGLGWFPGDA